MGKGAGAPSAVSLSRAYIVMVFEYIPLQPTHSGACFRAHLHPGIDRRRCDCMRMICHWLALINGSKLPI